METVNSFLSNDAIYKVNPMNGRAFRDGLSGRIQILGLPTIYAILSKTFTVLPTELVWHVIPIITLMASVMAYYRFARVLFGEHGKWNYLFLFLVLIIYLYSDQAYFLDGFAALHGGYLGSSIRNLVLLPLVWSIALSMFSAKGEHFIIRRGKGELLRLLCMLVLCFVTEASISPTFMGSGMCILSFFLWMFLVGIVRVGTLLSTGTKGGREK